MQFLSQQADANFAVLKCKPGAISRRFYSEITRDLGEHNKLEQQFRYSAGANTLFSMRQLKAAFFIFKVSISLVTIIISDSRGKDNENCRKWNAFDLFQTI